MQTQWIGSALIAIAATYPGGLNAQTAGTCSGVVGCAQVRNFVATISDLRFSVAGPVRVVTATIHFENRSTQPLILGYVQQSGVATDDRGNRYAVYGDAAVRGMGQIGNNTFDPKFVLQPGEGSDARFEFTWRPDSHVIYGTAYDLDLAIREIKPVTATQLKLGSEFALHFPGLTPPFSSAMSHATQVTTTQPTAAPTLQQASPVAPALPVVDAVSNACGTAAHCFSTGAFTASVTSLTGSRISRHHLIEIRIRFRNMSTQPLILAYTATSGSAVDNMNNRYYWGRPGTYDRSVKGIGMVQGRSADPQFILQPGESRDATFQAIRYDVGNQAIGTTFTYDLSVEQLQVLPSQQVQSMRQYALHLDNLAAGSMSGVPAQNVANVVDAVNKLKGLFKGRKP